MELKDFVAQLQPEERATYSTLVAEAEGSPVSTAGLRRRLARLVMRVQERSGEDPNPGPLIRAFLGQHLARIAAVGDVPLSELVQQFPYPLALKLNLLLTDHERQLAGEGLPRFPYDLCVTMGLLVRLAALIGIQSYVRIAGATDAALNRQVLETLRAPSDGAWRDLAVDVLTAVEKRPDALLARKTRAALASRVPVPGVSHVDRFAAADVFVNTPGSPGGASARLFAVNPSYLRHHPWVRAMGGSLSHGALLGQTLRDYSPAFARARVEARPTTWRRRPDPLDMPSDPR